MPDGELVGIMLSFGLFSSKPLPDLSVRGIRRKSSGDRRQMLYAVLQSEWHKAQSQPASSLAADMGVKMLNGDILLNCPEPCFDSAFHALHNKLRILFPGDIIIR